MKKTVKNLAVMILMFALTLSALSCGGAAQKTETTATTKESSTAVTKAKKILNPISERSMPDPFVTYHNGYYYGLATEAFSVKLYRGKSLSTLFKAGESKELIKTGDDIGTGQPLGANIWAPEMHYIPKYNKWYVYACASKTGSEFNDIRMFCLESKGEDPFGDYTFKGFTLDKLCIDQTIFYDEEGGRLYTAYSEFTGEYGQVITLAEMSDPWTIGRQKVMVSYPKFAWEKKGIDPSHSSANVNEGPIFLKSGDRLFLIYSASGCWSEYYCLGMLEYVGADYAKNNFLNADNWKKSDKPVFKEANEVYGVGHCSFFNSPDGTETWIAYHGMATPDAGEGGRYAYVQKIDFAEDGTPILGEPLPRSERPDAPSSK